MSEEKIKYKILAVDDSTTNILLLKGILESDDYHILTAYNGLKAWEIIQSEPIDLILLDIMMPKLSGLSLLEKMQIYKIKVPVIIISAKTSQEDYLRAKELGALEYFTKPLNMKELITKIKEILK